MTSHSSDEIVHAAAAVLVEDVGAIVRRAVGRLTEDLPTYARLPSEQLAGDVRAITEVGVRVFAATLEAPGRSVPVEYLAAVSTSAAQRAEEGVPVSDVVRAYFVGVQTCLAHVREVLGPRLLDGFPDLTVTVLDYLREVSAAVADGYVQERQLTLGDGVSARLHLAAALVEGSSDDVVADAAALAGVEVAPVYTVLAISVGTEPPASGPGEDAAVVRARTVRRVRTRLLGRLGPDVLWLPGYRDALVLIPGRTDGPAAGADAVTALDAVPFPVIAGLARGRRTGSGVSSAARTALDVRDLAVRLARPPGCYGMDDLALEYQISRPGPARDALSAVVGPLDPEPTLRSTLRTFVEENRHRQRTARRLGVHPNTVDNRLRRIAELTGLDPNRPRDMTRLEAAVTAARFSLDERGDGAG